MTSPEPNSKSASGQLREILDEVINAKPTPDAFTRVIGVDDNGSPTYGPDPTAYNDAFTQWATLYRQTANDYQQLADSDLGLVTLADGTQMAIGDLTPEEAAAVNAANQNVYQSALNRFGLDAYAIEVGRTDRENTKRQADFENQVTKFDRNLSVDQNNLQTATAELSRWLGGMDAANSAATLKQNAQRSAIDYGTTGGKTAFSANDLGGAIGALAGQAGIKDMGAPLLKYPGYQTMDPIGDIEAARTAYGTGGAAPMIPAPTTNAGMIPQAPQLLSPNEAVPGMPAMSAPPLAMPAQQPVPFVDPQTQPDFLFPRYAGGTGAAPPLMPDMGRMTAAAGLPAWAPPAGWGM